jgi:hypothetical protein
MIDVELAYEATGIVGDRTATHGPPELTIQRIALLWGAYLNIEVKPEEVAQMMLLVKIARARQGYSRDHYLDALGYTLIAESMARPWSESK